MDEAKPQDDRINDFDCVQAFLRARIALFVEVAEVILVQWRESWNLERSKWRLIMPLTAAMRSGHASV